MNGTKRFLCFIVVVLGFTFFSGLAESKGATSNVSQYVLTALSAR
jgi:hypothetical protein